jgi:MBOAT, membrane-bound O-acyltransferase family
VTSKRKPAAQAGRVESGRVVTLTKYIEQRLGSTASQQAVNLLARPFGADSFAGFWRYWNPVWSYYLTYYCYRPLRDRMPRPLAVWLTFLLCGFAHDLPFVAIAFLNRERRATFSLTMFFALAGGVVVVTERLRIRFAGLPTFAKWALHAAMLMACYKTALLLTATHPK